MCKDARAVRDIISRYKLHLRQMHWSCISQSGRVDLPFFSNIDGRDCLSLLKLLTRSESTFA